MIAGCMLSIKNESKLNMISAYKDTSNETRKIQIKRSQVLRGTKDAQNDLLNQILKQNNCAAEG